MDHCVDKAEWNLCRQRMSDETISVKKRLKAKKICDVLIRYYGREVSARKLPPLDELVMTILSQHTNDVNMFRAYESLKERFATWEEVLEAPQEEVAASEQEAAPTLSRQQLEQLRRRLQAKFQ